VKRKNLISSHLHDVIKLNCWLVLFIVEQFLFNVSSLCAHERFFSATNSNSLLNGSRKINRGRNSVEEKIFHSRRNGSHLRLSLSSPNYKENFIIPSPFSLITFPSLVQHFFLSEIKFSIFTRQPQRFIINSLI
jgi:hypothetical protein